MPGCLNKLLPAFLPSQPAASPSFVLPQCTGGMPAGSRAVGTVSSASAAFKDPFKLEVLPQGPALLGRVRSPAGQVGLELFRSGLESVCPQLNSDGLVLDVTLFCS